MQNTTNELNHLLTYFDLENLEENLFRGQSLDIGTGRIFGGQALSQALKAAYQTTKDQQVHSLHAYFLREGDCNKPVIYQVERARDGRTFSNRRVSAIQNGKPILILSASFQRHESGLEHQKDMPDVPKPDDLTEKTLIPGDKIKHLSPRMRRTLTTQGPFEFRFVDDVDPFDSEPKQPIKRIWFKARYPLEADQACHRTLLTFVSDFHLVSTATLPHGISYLDPRLQFASLDHAMWFHRPFQIDDWLLYDCDSPSASEARGFATGHVFDIHGKLVASTAQQGLMRLWDEAK
ncbi:acyl-CoA thioesterase [Marinicella sediminis]|uniref:Acyl-CoA thioesterase n=1 Tax=Marinicella sediminis TaxID=1792834 RepID=A0ABV7J6X5_9GAMM|nr:acyl-CoA thioesterase II [Marinicella sediminis]